MELTELESKIMSAFDQSNFDETETWVWELFDLAEIDPKVGRGVISSLVQKGLIEVFDYEGDGRSDDMFAVNLTKQ